MSTGRSEGQLEHWLNELPEHDAQSGWQVMHCPEELNVLEGHDETHEPLDASWLFAQVKQKVEEPAQVPHDESQAGRRKCQELSAAHPGEHLPVQVTLSFGSRKVLLGQLAMHLPPDRTKPGRQPVHWT